MITETSMMTVGLKVNPHLFRTAGVTTLATRAWQQTLRWWRAFASSSVPVTQENDNRAIRLSAG